MRHDLADNGRGAPAPRPRDSGRPQLTVAARSSPEADRPATPAPRRRPRGPGGFAWLAVIPAGILAIVLVVHADRPAPAPLAHQAVVVASLPYWNIGPGTAAVLGHRRDVNQVSPWMYGVGSKSQIILDSGINESAIKVDLGRLRAQGLPVVPTIANVDARGNWSYGPVARVLHDPAMARRQVADIVRLAVANRYAGIDLDYENLHAGDRHAFTAFVGRLAAALHARGKVLSVALFAKATNAGYAPRNVAQDYAAIGKVADQVRLMGYDYHWATSPPGPIAPTGWVRDVIKYAKTQIPASKIVLGVPQYGYDWSGGHGTSVTWLQALALSRRYRVPPRYDAASQSPWFAYTDASGHRHIVWFENAESSRAKFDLARASGIGGVYIWMYGNGDPGTWSALHQVLPLGARAANRAGRGAS